MQVSLLDPASLTVFHSVYIQHRFPHRPVQITYIKIYMSIVMTLRKEKKKHYLQRNVDFCL